MGAPAVAVEGIGEGVGQEPGEGGDGEPAEAEAGHAAEKEGAVGLKVAERLRGEAAQKAGHSEDDDEDKEREPFLHGGKLASGEGLDHFKIIAVGEVVATAAFEVDFTDAFFVAEDFDLFAEFLTDGGTVSDGPDFDDGAGAVRGIEDDGGEAEDAEPEGFLDFGVLDAVEFDLVDFLVEDALVEAHAFAGEFEDAAFGAEPEPSGIGGGEKDADEEEGVGEGEGDEGEGHEAGEDKWPKVDDLGGPAFPYDAFFVFHGTRILPRSPFRKYRTGWVLEWGGWHPG